MNFAQKIHLIRHSDCFPLTFLLPCYVSITTTLRLIPTSWVRHKILSMCRLLRHWSILYRKIYLEKQLHHVNKGTQKITSLLPHYSILTCRCESKLPSLGYSVRIEFYIHSHSVHDGVFQRRDGAQCTD